MSPATCHPEIVERQYGFLSRGVGFDKLSLTDKRILINKK